MGRETSKNRLHFRKTERRIPGQMEQNTLGLSQQPALLEKG